MAAPFDTGRPHPARVYDFLLGGKDNFAADRAAAAEGLQANPNAATAPLQNRAFLRRTVRFLAAEAGIRQFTRFFTGLEGAEPGVVPIRRWRPDVDDGRFTDAQVALYGGVARKA